LITIRRPALARLHALLPPAILLVTGLLLPACGPADRYFGLSLSAPVSPDEQARLASALRADGPKAGACRWQPAGAETALALPCRDVPLVALARLAAANDKQAQLELGIRFEEGIGVERDRDAARKLYRMAARDSSSGTPIGFQNYSGNLLDPAGAMDNPANDPRNARGLAPAWTSPRGLPEARARLAALEARER
jgi:TPR repeat protein